MAKAPAQAAAATEAPPKKGKKLLIIVLALVVVVLIAVAGVVVLLINKNKGGEAAHEEAKSSHVDLSHPPTFVPLDSFTVNLAPDEGSHYLQVMIVFQVPDAHMGESLKGFMPEIRHRINLLLSSKLPSQLATIEGREGLADEIREEANAALGYEPPKRAKHGEQDWEDAPVQAVLFNSLIIQ